MKPRIFVFSLLILSLIVVTVKAEPNCDKPNPFYSWGLRSNPPRCEGLNDKEPTGGKPLEFLSLVIRRLSQEEVANLPKTIFLEVPKVQDAEIQYGKMIGKSSNSGSDYLLNRFTIPENNKFEWPSNVLKEALKKERIPIKNLYPKAEALLKNKTFYLPVTLGPGDNPGKYEFVWASIQSFSITRIEIYKIPNKELISVKSFNKNHPDHAPFIFTWNGKKDKDGKDAGSGMYQIDFVGKRGGKSLNESYLFHHDPKLLGKN
jgi:hypothetical protein